MKEHLRKYFPERFEDSDNFKLANKIFSVFSETQSYRDKAKCERKVMSVFAKSNELKLLAGAMKKHGCNFSLARHIACEACKSCCGGYDPDTNQIVVCHTSLANNHQIHATILHEMIHMFDFCRAKMDFNNLEHIACSEVS